MPHTKMQEYVNIDYRNVMSIVGVIEEGGMERIIAEARYARDTSSIYADLAFIVDERYQGYGIASFMFDLLIRIGREQGIKGFVADVLADNKSMLKVFEKSPFPVKAVLTGGVYKLTIPFTSPPEVNERDEAH